MRKIGRGNNERQTEREGGPYTDKNARAKFSLNTVWYCIGIVRGGGGLYTSYSTKFGELLTSIHSPVV
jgi:hypothetical protein